MSVRQKLPPGGIQAPTLASRPQGDSAIPPPGAQRKVAILGRLGIHPLVKLSLPARRLLAYLALRGQPVVRTAAAADLWLDLPEETGRANLRRALWHVPRGWVSVIGDELALDAEIDLETAGRVAARALDGGSLNFEEIVLLSQDILPGWHDEWLLPAQEAFHQLRVQALEAACRSMAQAGSYALATQAGLAATAAEPLCESAAEALINAHLGQRNRYQAMQCFRNLAKRLEFELGVAPHPSLAERVADLRFMNGTTH